MKKQDRQGARTPAGLEQKYGFGRFFSEQEKVNARQNSELNQTNLTMKEFISLATTSIEKLQKDMTAANRTMQSISEKNAELEAKNAEIEAKSMELEESNKALVESNSSLQNQLAKYWETVYPVGSVYMSLSNKNPTTLFGGTWERLKDTFLLAAGDTYAAGTTGGEAEHNHQYGIQYNTYHGATPWESTATSGVLVYDKEGNISISTQNTIGTDTINVNSNSAAGKKSVSANRYRHYGTTSATNNMPPYTTVYVWKRTA